MSSEPSHKTDKTSKKDINKQAEKKAKKSGTSTFVKGFIIFISIAMVVPLLASLIFQLF